jgi:hypothetical protein
MPGHRASERPAKTAFGDNVASSSVIMEEFVTREGAAGMAVGTQAPARFSALRAALSTDAWRAVGVESRLPEELTFSRRC